MSYPQQVPPGWTRGERVVTFGTGPRYAVGRPISLPSGPVPADDFLIEFDSYDDAKAWLAWWRQPTQGAER